MWVTELKFSSQSVSWVCAPHCVWSGNIKEGFGICLIVARKYSVLCSKVSVYTMGLTHVMSHT